MCFLPKPKQELQHGTWTPREVSSDSLNSNWLYLFDYKRYIFWYFWIVLSWRICFLFYTPSYFEQRGDFQPFIKYHEKPHCLSTLCQSLSWSYPWQKWVISVHQTTFRPPKFALEQCTIWFLSKLYRGLVWRPHFFNTDFQTNCFSRS